MLRKLGVLGKIRDRLEAKFFKKYYVVFVEFRISNSQEKNFGI